MATTITLYNHTRKLLADGSLDLDTDVLKAVLVTSAYTFDGNHTSYYNVVSQEVAAGAGYTVGGLDFTGQVVTQSGANSIFSADNLVWPLLTATFRYAVIYDDTYLLPGLPYGSAPSQYKPLIACILLDSTPADVVVSNIDYSIQWNPAGIITFS